MKIMPYIKSLYVLGDIGFYNSSFRNLVSNFKHKVMFENNHIALLGDNFYPDGIKTFNDRQWKSFEYVFGDIPYHNMCAIMGNHDYYGDPNLQLRSNNFNNHEFFFKRSMENVDLFFLDTVLLFKGHCKVFDYHIYKTHKKSYMTLKEEQLNWLESELEVSKENGKKIIVFGHYPILTNGFYANEMEPLYNLLIPIFEKYKISAYVSGHEHNIQYIYKDISEDYTFHQFINGCSSQYRKQEFCLINENYMFEDDDFYYLQIREDNNDIFFEFKNKYGIIKHCMCL